VQSDGINDHDQELKHLGFVKIAAIQAFVCMSSLYDYAKQNSGPLRSAVGTVEGTVTTVLGPVYHKFKPLPQDLLRFFDNKVSLSLKIFFIQIRSICYVLPWKITISFYALIGT
jgi:hypothetical protein